MVKLSIFSLLLYLLVSCGVKKPPTPLYTIPDTALKNTPTPSPTPHE